MKPRKEKVYAFIDSNNVNLGIKDLGWKKLACVMSPYVKTCSILLKKSAKEKIVFMDNLRKKLAYKAHKVKKHRLRTKP